MYIRLNNLDINIYEMMLILLVETLLFRSGLNLKNRILSDIFN